MWSFIVLFYFMLFYIKFFNRLLAIEKKNINIWFDLSTRLLTHSILFCCDLFYSLLTIIIIFFYILILFIS